MSRTGGPSTFGVPWSTNGSVICYGPSYANARKNSYAFRSYGFATAEKEASGHTWGAYTACAYKKCATENSVGSSEGGDELAMGAWATTPQKNMGFLSSLHLCATDYFSETTQSTASSPCRLGWAWASNFCNRLSSD